MFDILSAKLVVTCALALAVVRLARYVLAKSSLHDVPGPARSSLITGNLSQVFDPWGVQWQYEMFKKYGRVWKVNGMLGDVQLFVSDPKVLHHILVKDQDIFEPSSMISSNKLILGNGLGSTLGDQHKKQRKLLNPVFSRAHMQDVIPIFNKITHQLRKTLVAKFDSDRNPKEIDMMLWFSRAALEYVGQAGLGYSFDNLEGDDDNEYSKAVKSLLGSVMSVHILRPFIPLITRLASPSFLGRLIDFVPYPALKNLKRVTGVMHDTSVEVFEAKKKALQKGDASVKLQVGGGKDIMSVLLRANAEASGEDQIPESEVLAQMNTMTFAAHDTTSTALCRILHVLSLHPEAQEKLREEVMAARKQYGDLEYEELEALTYLDAVVRETLRLYAPIIAGSRTTRRDVVLPLGTPIISTSGKKITELHLKNNTSVILGHGVSNKDKGIWGEDAEEWKPERWIGRTLEEVAKEKLPGVYSGMMTFMGGSRACIGFRFSLLEMKVALTILLESFEFGLGEREVRWKNNIVLSPRVEGVASPCFPVKVTLLKTTM